MAPTEGWPRVQVHPGAGVVVRRGDALLVVPVLPTAPSDRLRELLGLCSRPDPTGVAGTAALQRLLDLCPPAEMPGFALLQRTGSALRVLVHGPVQVFVDGRPAGRPGSERLAAQVVEDGAWHVLAISADGVPGTDGADRLALDLEAGAVPGGGVTLHAAAVVPEPPARSETALRP